MKCEEVRKRIYPLLDDELETETNIEVLSHLNVCDRCQKKFEAERNFLNDLSDALTDRTVPEDVQEDLQRRLEEAREKKGTQSWFARGKRWNQLMSAAVFLVLVITAGILSNYFPLHRGGTAEQTIHTFPKYHQDVIDRNKEKFEQHLNTGPFKNFDEVTSELIERFPAFRDRLQVPSLGENQCEVLDAETFPSRDSLFTSPNFHVVYCYKGEKLTDVKKHEDLLMVGVKTTGVNLDHVSDLKPIKKSDDLYEITNDQLRSRCIFWKTDRFLMALITDGLERDHLVELARSARNEMEKISSTPSSGD